MTRETIRRYRASLQDEIDSAAQYRAMAAAERDARIAAIYARLAEAEDRHATFWEKKLAEAGLAPVRPRPSMRSRLLIAVARRLGARAILSTVTATEQQGRHLYRDAPEVAVTRMESEENAHARVLRAVGQASRRAEDGGLLARLEGRHRAVGGNALRAAVLGANDGLSSNLSLVMGLAGAAADGRALLLAGVAGLLAGACSMAIGEWLSVTSARELAQRELDIEKAELDEDPEGEAEELRLIYEAKGLTPDDARLVSGQMLRDPGAALDTLAREELGIDPGELAGSARQAAVTSFLLFALGAAIPVLPLLFASGVAAVVTSVVASAAAFVAIGAAIALLTGRGFGRSIGRQVVLGMGAAAVTFAIGRLLGVVIAG